MRFLSKNLSYKNLNKWQSKLKQYFNYLETVKDKMPKNAFNFAKAEWHYNAEDPRCPHDSWLKSLSINEVSSGKRSEIRDIGIESYFLGSYHNGHFELKYKRVTDYTLEKISKARKSKYSDVKIGHGDWLIDELILSNKGNVVHEIYFSNGSHWIIECEDIIYRWKPLTK